MDESNTKQIDQIKNLYQNAFSEQLQGRIPQCLQNARVAAEGICSLIYVEVFDKLPDKLTTLEGYLTAFKNSKELASEWYPPLEAIQKYGNFGSHHQIGVDMEALPYKYEQPCLAALDTLINLYFSSYTSENLTFSQGNIFSRQVLLQSKHVVLCYRRGQSLDESLAVMLEQHLKAAGYTVFAEQQRRSEKWLNKITQEIQRADTVIVLLSTASMYSEMLVDQVHIAYRTVQETAGRPRLIAVRINLDQVELPQELANLLLIADFLTWDGSEETASPNLVEQLLATLQQTSAKSKMKYELEMIGGAIPLDSHFYVERVVDRAFEAALFRRDSSVLLKGARQVGKTSLLARGLQKARDAGMIVLLTDFQRLMDSQLTSLETFFLSISEMLADQLDLEVYPQDKWLKNRAPNVNFDRYVRQEILCKTDKNVVWAIDEADRILSYDFSSDVFSLFRTWHNDRALTPNSPYARLTLVITYATEPYLFIKDLNQSPFNVGTKLLLEDFSLEQVADLNQRHGTPLSIEELQQFYELVGGQPFLVRSGFYEIISRQLSFAEFLAKIEKDESIFEDHLRRIVMMLRKDTELCDVMRGILRGQPCPTHDTFFRLRSAGIVNVNMSEQVGSRCQLYENYLRRKIL